MLGSPVDIAMVFGVVLILFGPKKVPEFGKALGQGIGNFKRALSEAQDEVKTAMSVDTPAAKPEEKSTSPQTPQEPLPQATSTGTEGDKPALP